MTEMNENPTQRRLSDALLDILKKETDPSKKDGLFLVDMPTGYGKSYAAQNLLGEFVANKDNKKRKIFYITPQKKNLPKEDEIIRAFQLAGIGAPKPGQVLRVQPLYEMLALTAQWDVLHHVPKRFSDMREFKNLIDAAECYRKAVERSKDPDWIMPGYEELIRKKLSEAEYEFRQIFSKSLARKDECDESSKKLSKKKRIKRLREERDWQWLGRLYPTAFTAEAQVFLMSVDKFLYNHVTLVEEPYRFIDSEYVKGSVVIIDEFDASKSDMLEKIISDSVKTKVDLPQLVKTIHSSFLSKEYPRELIRMSNRRKNNPKANTMKENLDNGKSVVEAAFKDANLKYEYKADPDETSGDFIFYDFRHNATMGRGYEIVVDNTDNVNRIQRIKKGKDVTSALTEKLGTMRGAVHYMQRMIGTVALNYQECQNEDRGSDDGYTIDSAQKTVLEWLGFSKRSNEQHFMLEGIKTHFRKSRKKGQGAASALMAGDLSVYEQGFHCISLEDSDDHDMCTHMLMYAMQTTPESVLAQLMERARVIGLSATSTVDSAFCNYDLDYLGRQSKGGIEYVSEAELKEMRKAFETQNSGYDNVEIRARLVSQRGDVCGWQALLGNNEAGSEAFDCVAECDRHSRDRYARFAAAYKYFLENEDIRSMLALAMTAPKKDSGNFRQEILTKICTIVGQCLGVIGDAGNSLRFIKGSARFDTDFESVRNELASGDRIFLVAAYATMGTGVNIQYPIPEGVDTVEIYSGDGATEKDFDAIYLDRPTVLAPYARQIDERQLMNDLFEVCELRERGEIGAETYSMAYKGLAKCRVSGKAKRLPRLRGTKSAKGRATRYVNQAIGRICRTNNKSPVIHILADEDLSNRMDLFAMDGCMVNREYEVLVDMLKTHVQDMKEPGTDLEAKAELVSTRLNTKIQKLVRSSSWSQEDIRFWERLRLAVLSYPTCDEDTARANHGLIGNTYVRLPNPAVEYTYAQDGDFNDVRISLDPENTLDNRVCQENARLNALASVPSVARYFESRCWPLRWAPGDYIMSPVLFHNIYLGALGEQVGKFLMESHIPGVSLEQIEDGNAFEKFDFRVAGTNIYFDFKYWSVPSGKSEKEEEKWIISKMANVDASKVVICNVLAKASKGFRCNMLGKGTILTVPYLIDEETSQLNLENVNQIRTFIEGR